METKPQVTMKRMKLKMIEEETLFEVKIKELWERKLESKKGMSVMMLKKTKSQVKYVKNFDERKLKSEMKKKKMELRKMFEVKMKKKKMELRKTEVRMKELWEKKLEMKMRMMLKGTKL
jgi:hypothetical protein